MQAVYILLTIIGLIVCLGGIYFRKPITALTGFINGLFLGAIVLLIIMLTSDDVGSELVIVLGIAILVSIICVAFDKFFAALSAFISSLLIFVIVALSICDYETIGTGIIVAIIGSVLLAVVSYMYYKYSFVIVTAFTGGLAAAIGITLLFTDNSIDSYVSNLLWGESSGLGLIVAITFVLAGVGAYVQITGINKQEELRRKIESGEIEESNASIGQPKIDLSKIVDILKKNWIVITMPVLATFIPIIFGQVFNFHANIVTWAEDITIAIMLGCMVYVITKDRVRDGIIIAVVYNILHILSNYKNYFVSDYAWGIGVITFKGLIVGAILIALHVIIKNKNIKVVIFPIIAYISFEYVCNWISTVSLFAISFDITFIICVIIVYLTVFVLYYHGEKTLIYTDKKSIIALIIVVVICGGIWGLQKWQTIRSIEDAKGGWQNYEDELDQYNKDDKWTAIEKDEEYEKLIEGNISVEQLEALLRYFPDGAVAEDINSLYEEDSYWMTFTICDSLEQQTMEEDFTYTLHTYNLKDVNDTLKGFTSFQYKKNTQYSEEEYTDGKYLYLMIPATGWFDETFIKNIRGRYNKEEMIVDYDWYEYYYEGYEPEELYLYSLSAVFNKNDSGNFVLKEIRAFEE